MLSEHGCIKIKSEKPFDLALFHPMAIKALLGYDFLNAVRTLEYLLGLHVSASRGKHKLTGCRHLHLYAVKEENVLFEYSLDLRVAFRFHTPYEVCLVVIKALRRVGTLYLDVGDCRQHEHELPYLRFHACLR